VRFLPARGHLPLRLALAIWRRCAGGRGDFWMPRWQLVAINRRMRWRQRSSASGGRRLKRFQEFDERLLLLRHQLIVAGHLEKPRRVAAMLNHTENPGWIASAGVLAGDVVKLARLARDRDAL